MNRSITRRHAMGLLAAASGLLCARSRASTPRIDETGFVRIGGIEQWVGIQGSNVENPVILYLHGGPAEAQSPLLREFVPWETDFTVVNWDQRGSGQTYGKNGPSTPGMATASAALGRLSEDARDVAEYARKRLSKEKIILVGQSWGAVLGLHVVKRWPQLFHAFVGTGQPVSWAIILRAHERWARLQAIAAGDRQTLDALRDTSSLPVSDMRRFMASRKYIMSPSDLEYLKLQSQMLGKLSKADQTSWAAGGAFTLSKLSPLIFSFDIRKLGFDIPVPFFVVQGRDDHVVSFDAARAYVAEVRAPRKAFIPIAGGHYACFTDPTAFVEALRRYVRPLAVE